MLINQLGNKMKAWLIKTEDGRYYTGSSIRKSVPNHLFADTNALWLSPVIFLNEDSLMEALKELDNDNISAKAVEIYI